MSSLNGFRSDADRILNNITVTSELKEKTLKQFQEKRKGKTSRRLIPAACLAAALILVIAPGSPLSIFHKVQSNIPNPGETANILMADPNKPNTEASTLPAGTEVSPAPSGNSMLLDNLDEAKKYLDGAVLIPSNIPEGFELHSIQAVSSENGTVENIYLLYTLKDRDFVISMEKGKEWKDFSEYKDVDINSSTGHIKSYNPGQEISELRWFAGDVLYTVEGSLSEEEAIRIAKSLK